MAWPLVLRLRCSEAELMNKELLAFVFALTQAVIFGLLYAAVAYLGLFFLFGSVPNAFFPLATLLFGAGLKADDIVGTWDAFIGNED